MKHLNKQVEKIKKYHEELGLKSTVDYEDTNFHLAVFHNLYEDCEIDGLQEFLFSQTVHSPLYNIFSYIQTDSRLDVDSWNGSGNKFMLTNDEVMEFLLCCNSTTSRLLLGSITVPTAVYSDLSNAILNKDPESLKEAATNHDLSELYKKIGILTRLRNELIGDGAEYDSVRGTTNDLVLYAFRDFNTPNALDHYDYITASYEDAKSITEQMIDDFYYHNYSIYSRFEIDSIWKIINGNPAFENYYKSISKEKEFGTVSLSCPKKQEGKPTPNLISGVKGLAEALGCGKNTAQKILNKGILQKANIAYHAGKGWRINRTRLFEYISMNPNAFKE